MKALIVDDSRAMRAILARALLAAGFIEVAHARHGQDGLAYLTSHPDTSLALVDWNMPEMTGIEMVAAVRRDAALADVRLMMVTSATDVAHMQRALDAGADEYVMKPFTREAIADKLRLLGFARGWQ
jgi:two-component system chemotaxis response regulator CheY